MNDFADDFIQSLLNAPKYPRVAVVHFRQLWFFVPPEKYRIYHEALKLTWPNLAIQSTVHNFSTQQLSQLREYKDLPGDTKNVLWVLDFHTIDPSLEPFLRAQQVPHALVTDRRQNGKGLIDLEFKTRTGEHFSAAVEVAEMVILVDRLFQNLVHTDW